MTEVIGVNQITDDRFKKYKPILTIICCLASIILFIGINLEAKIEDWGIYKKWGSPPPTDIFNGDYWGLITSNFLHTEIWHIAFNLFWLWYFGKKKEFESNKIYYGLIILSSAFVSSVSQLAFSDSTGIGLSGIVYSLFGFIFIKGKTDDKYKNYLDKKTVIIFIFWLVLCIILTQTNVWIVGNAAHVGGLLWGATLAFVSKFKKHWQIAIGIVFLTTLTSLISWSPFSISYLSHKAYELHKNQKFEEAIVIYKKILERDSDNEFANENLKQLEVDKLSKQAFELHSAGKYNEARQLYNKILSIDKDNEWAKNNLNILPVVGSVE